MAELDLGLVVGADGKDGSDGQHASSNLLDNSNWQKKADIINQRGRDAYKVNDYTIDRWRTWSATAEVSISDQGLTTNATLYQYLDIDQNATYTAAVCKADGSIVCISGIPKDGFSWSPITVVVGSNKLVAFTFTAGTYKWAALYKGAFTKDTLPAYTPKGYAAELAECQRYYREIKATENPLSVGVGVAVSSALYLPLYVGPMRIKPTVTYAGIAATNADVSSANVNGLSLFDYDVQSGHSTLKLTASSTLTNQNMYRVAVMTDGYIRFSADR